MQLLSRVSFSLMLLYTRVYIVFKTLAADLKKLIFTASLLVDKLKVKY